MKLINTDGLSLIGPGSEWFWTALSGLVLAITFIAIYRQLRLQADAAAIAQLSDIEHEWSSERLARAKLTVLLALDAGLGPDELPDRAVAEIGFFWQRVGYLVRSGHIDRVLVYEHLGDQVQFWSAFLRPHWPNFAWFAEVAAAMDAKRGRPAIGDMASFIPELPDQITHFRDAIKVFEELRSVTVRLTPTPLPVSGLWHRGTDPDVAATTAESAS